MPLPRRIPTVSGIPASDWVTQSYGRRSSRRCSGGRSHEGRDNALAGVAELHDDVVSLTVIEQRDRIRIDRSAVQLGRPNAAALMIRVEYRNVIARASHRP